MRIAIMLALHNNPEQANIFINQCLSHKGCDVFIHIDKKGLEIKEKLVKSSRVHILPKSFSVCWGDYSQIEYVLELMKYIGRQGSYDYYSIHSGNDLLVRPLEELMDFLENSHQYAYLDCHPLPWKGWQYGGGLGRLALKWPRCFRKRLEPHSIQRYARAIYGRMYSAKLIKGKTLPKDVKFWGKSAWYILSEECVVNCLEYLKKNPNFLSLFQNSLCGDEIFFATLVNITGENKDIWQNNNLRYIDFNVVDKKSVGAPKTLTIVDKEKIIESGAFFARKVDLNVDKEIIAFFQKYCVTKKMIWTDEK